MESHYGVGLLRAPFYYSWHAIHVDIDPTYRPTVTRHTSESSDTTATCTVSRNL